MEPDDLDHLFATAPAPPPALHGRLLRRAAVERRSGRLLAAMVADGAGVLLLGLFALLLVRRAADSGARELALLALQDTALVRSYPSEYFSAVGQAMPWAFVFAFALDTVAVILLTGYLLRATDTPPRRPEARR